MSLPTFDRIPTSEGMRDAANYASSGGDVESYNILRALVYDIEDLEQAASNVYGALTQVEAVTARVRRRLNEDHLNAGLNSLGELQSTYLDVAVATYCGKRESVKRVMDRAGVWK